MRSTVKQTQQYARHSLQPTSGSRFRGHVSLEYSTIKLSGRPTNDQRKCYACGSPDHLDNRCDTKRQESQGLKQPEDNRTNKPNQTGTSQPKKAKKVVGEQDTPTKSIEHSELLIEDLPQNPMDVLYSLESDDDGVLTVHLSDNGSRAQCVRLLVQDVSAIGIVNTAADITIRGKLF